MKNKFRLRWAVVLTGILTGVILSAGMVQAYPYFSVPDPDPTEIDDPAFWGWHSCVSISGTTTTTLGLDSNGGESKFDNLKGLGLRLGADTEEFGYDEAYRACMDIHPNNLGVATTNFTEYLYTVRGWVWNDNLGWVSFDCEDWTDVPRPLAMGGGVFAAGEVCGLTGNYSTEVDFYGYFHGYAWSTVMGWIQFDWEYDGVVGSCDETGVDLTKPCDGYYLARTGGEIPKGRVLDNYMGRVDVDASGVGDDTKGKFWGWAWNDAVGWVSFNEAFGIENTTGVGDDHDDEIWHPVSLRGELLFTPRAGEWADPAETDDAVVVWADGEDKYILKIKFRTYPFGLTDYLPRVNAACVDDGIVAIYSSTGMSGDTSLVAGDVYIEDDDLVPANDGHLSYDQINDAGEVAKSTVENYIDPVVVAGEEFSLVEFTSPVPTSNVNGYLDGFTFMSYDNPSNKYQYNFKSVDLKVDACLGGVALNELIFLGLGEDENYDWADVDGAEDRYLKFKPAVFMAGMTQNGQRVVKGQRNTEAQFDMLFQRSERFEEEAVIEFELGVTGMNYVEGENKYGNILDATGFVDNADFHFVFDQPCMARGEAGDLVCGAGEKFFGADGVYDYLDIPVGYLALNKEFFTDVNDWDLETKPYILKGMPVLRPGESAASFVLGPVVDARRIRYTFEGNNIVYISDKLGRGEAVSNPVAEITGTISATAGIVEVQTGQSVLNVGNITTNVLRNTIFQNVVALRRGLAGDVWKMDGDDGDVVLAEDWTASQSGVEKGLKIFNSQVFYFKRDGGGAVALVLRNGGSAGDNEINWSGDVSAAERTVIVEGGNIFIDDDLGDDEQIGLVAMKDASGVGGNIYIHPDVTRVNAVIFADGLLTSYDGDRGNIEATAANGNTYPVPQVNVDGKLKCKDDLGADKIVLVDEVFHNQLYIKGSITSKNTIGGSDKLVPIIGTGEELSTVVMDRMIAKFYDLNFLRYYRLEFEMDAGGSLVCETSGDFNCEYEHLDVAGGGDVEFRAAAQVQCALPNGNYEDKSAFGAHDSVNGIYELAEEKLSPIYIEYEAPSPTLPGFWSEGNVPGALQVNR